MRPMKKLLLALAVVLVTGAAEAADSCGVPCVNVPCAEECWSVRIHYKRDGITLIASEDTLWGALSGAYCRADQISATGFWIMEWEHPTKIPASMLELVVIDRATAATAARPVK